MSDQKVLGIKDIHGIVGFDSINDGGPAGSGKKRQPLPQTLYGFRDAPADKAIICQTGNLPLKLKSYLTDSLEVKMLLPNYLPSINV
jgi:hypothetical protein